MQLCLFLLDGVGDRERRRHERHVGDENHGAGQQIQHRHGDPAPEQLEDRDPLVLHREEIVCTFIDMALDQKQVDAGDQKHQNHDRQDRLREVAELRTVEPERCERKSLDDDHEMCAVEAEHARKPDRISVESDRGAQERHQRAERRHEEAEAHQRTALRRDGDRDQHHVDVAKLQRQLRPPGKSAARFDDELVVLRVDGQEVFIDEEADERDETGDDQNDPPRLFAAFFEDQTCNHEQRDEERKACEEQRIERAHDPERFL